MRRFFVQSACNPLAAVRYRIPVIAVKAFLWDAATFVVAVSDNSAQPRYLWRG